MKKTQLFIVMSMLISAVPAHAERAEPMQNVTVSQKSIKPQNASAFLGIGGKTFPITVPAIKIDMGTTTASGAQKTGVVHKLTNAVTPSQLSWEATEGGYMARVSVRSEQAKSLRFHLTLENNNASTQFRVKGNLDNAPIGPVSTPDPKNNDIWLPVTTGNSAELEVFVNSAALTDKLNFTIDAVNIIVLDTNSLNDSSNGIHAKSLGLAQSKEYDLACWNGQEKPALQQAAAATALIQIVENGESGFCTGTLLTDTQHTGKPWFATANHCVSTQAAASSIDLKWFYQAQTCNQNNLDARYEHTFGGAELLWTDVKLEATLLRLNNKPASNAVFSGWDTDVKIGDLVWGVHHPQTDHTMVSEGNVSALLNEHSDFGDNKIHLLDTINYQKGGIESGSSGSGLFSVNNGNAYWKGTLTGGPSNNYQIADYSHFDSYYLNLKPWLDTAFQKRAICLLTWAENNYPSLFSPKRANTWISTPEIYGDYAITQSKLSISASDANVYYQGPNGIKQNVGTAEYWFGVAGCR